MKLAISIYKDDRVFLVKLLSGEDISTDDETYSISEQIDDFELFIERELENVMYTKTLTPHVHQDVQSLNVSFKENYPHLFTYLQNIVNVKKNKILEEIEKYGETPIHKVMLKELQITPTIYSFTHYTGMIVEWIHLGKYDKELIYDILKYLLVDYVPKDIYDTPYVKWSESDVLKTPGKGLKPIGLLYEDSRKWDERRIKLAKSIGKDKQILVVNDINWLWCSILIEEGKIADITQLTYNDVLLREFLSNLLFRLTWILLSTHIVFNRLNTEQLQRLDSVVKYIDYIISTNSEVFTFALRDYLIPEQVKNQFMLVDDIENINVTKEMIQKVLDEVTSRILELETQLETTHDTTTQHDIKNTLKLLEQTLKELEYCKNKSEIKLSKMLHILVANLKKKTQITDVDVIEFLSEHKLIKKVEVL